MKNNLRQVGRFADDRLELGSDRRAHGQTPSRAARERHHAVAREVRTLTAPRAPGLVDIADRALDLDGRVRRSRARRSDLLDETLDVRSSRVGRRRDRVELCT